MSEKYERNCYSIYQSRENQGNKSNILANGASVNWE